MDSVWSCKAQSVLPSIFSSLVVSHSLSLTLRKGCRLRVFENIILKRMYGPKKDENKEWRKLHNIWLRWSEHIARMEESTRVFKILTGISAGKRHLGRSRRRWEDNIRIDL